ncbi:hypothetical protein ACEWY4_026906 [Coilia grayii]|uniref:C2 domain-containing protein n=1 Tax=Coilia grayii TaxID=363190 RepID=A0ABD1IQZ3_9TELE
MSAEDGGEWPASHLTVTVLQARRLRPKNRRGNSSNPYVQVQLGSHSFTTHSVPNTLCPVWNNSMTFALPVQRDDALVVALMVMHRRSLAVLPDRFLGRAEVRVVDVCQGHQPVYRKWLALESKPKAKAKDRGEMEVSLRLENLHSYTTTAHSQLPSICPVRDEGWGNRERSRSSAVQTAEKCEPIQPSCAAVPGLDRAPPSVAMHTHEPAASPQCVSSSGDGESPECKVQALSDCSGLNDITAAKCKESTGKITDDKAGDGTTQNDVKEDGRPVPKKDKKENGRPMPKKDAKEDGRPMPRKDAREDGSLLLPRLGYMMRHLWYRCGLQANSGETQPLHVVDAPPETSDITEPSKAIPPGRGYGHVISERLHALCVWVDECLGNIRDGRSVTP